MKISKYWKAIAAATVATGGTVAAALDDGVITSGEIWLIAGAFLGGLGLTWAVPNRQTAKHAAPSE
jgi:hypothetical protein